ncbi:MAG: hypothetical protein JWQ63_3121 [Mucilaginibacter sp.]|nr:hypothetical protein [Mucilaginibacter sp.]
MFGRIRFSSPFLLRQFKRLSLELNFILASALTSIIMSVDAHNFLCSSERRLNSRGLFTEAHLVHIGLVIPKQGLFDHQSVFPVTYRTHRYFKCLTGWLNEFTLS